VDPDAMTAQPVQAGKPADRGCDCIGADVERVRGVVGADAIGEHMFSPLPVLVSAADAARMQAVIEAVERVVQLPAWRDAALADAPAIAGVPQSTRGVFFGFDFHIGERGPQLIEINTNAGGAMLSAAVRSAQVECCPEVRDYLRLAPDAGALERAIVDMFRAEWRLARGEAPLGRIAIVDDEPERQYLYPEFQMFQRLFASHGIEAVIADARELTLQGGRLMAAGRPVDLVYNRCTDFYFEQPAHAVLAEAYAADLAVITPHPRAHALYANKRNLAWLTDGQFLSRAGVSADDIELLLGHVPATRVLDGADEAWWADRKRWFFKPVDGFGSRGSYRGDKLTRRVFAELMRGRYVAQEFSPPGERRGRVDGDTLTFKVDVRNYVYAGRVQQRIARLYQGQTTNFRTRGGGFAPVYLGRMESSTIEE
jgi:hypothetical protein